MSPQQAATVYAALYGPSADDLRSGLPDIGDGLQAQLHELFRDPTPEAAERVAINLAGAQRAVQRFREALLREGAGDGR